MNPPILPGLFEVPVADIAGPAFDGATYQADKDQARLSGQLQKVAGRLETGGWWTLRALAISTGYPEASISARIRDLRKPKFGGHEIEHRRRTAGTWEYRLVRP